MSKYTEQNRVFCVGVWHAMDSLNAQRKIRIALAEDHRIIRQGLRHVLEQYPDLEVVGEAGDGKQALEVVKELHPDILLCDIRLPLLNGIRVVRLARKLSPETRSLILSAYDDDEYVLELMWAGASGYLLKTTTSSELADAVRKVYAGWTILHPEIAAKITRLWTEGNPHRDKPKELTVRETEILSLAGEELSNKAIAEKLRLSVRTVEKHFDNILSKLSVSSRKEAVRYGLKQHLIDIVALDK